MKKTATMTMMLVLASGLCACGADSDQTTVQQTDAKEGETVVLPESVKLSYFFTGTA